ncbi:hypothetical protein ACIBG4_37695 [Nonomuraea sp. NPDC050383]|uniref:hypothetical protein n=1 Tax=Nonomuraea sp. NPDC050383 TaxID=3364362 RepID=UPI0037995272
MPLLQIPLGGQRALAPARALHQLAHEGILCSTGEELTDKERKDSLPDARNYLESPSPPDSVRVWWTTPAETLTPAAMVRMDSQR